MERICQWHRQRHGSNVDTSTAKSAYNLARNEGTNLPNHPVFLTTTLEGPFSCKNSAIRVSMTVRNERTLLAMELSASAAALEVGRLAGVESQQFWTSSARLAMSMISCGTTGRPPSRTKNMTELSFFFWLNGIFPVKIYVIACQMANRCGLTKWARTSRMSMSNAYISVATVNSAYGSFSMSSEGLMSSGAVHLQAPAVLTDVNSEGSMINVRPVSQILGCCSSSISTLAFRKGLGHSECIGYGYSRHACRHVQVALNANMQDLPQFDEPVRKL